MFIDKIRKNEWDRVSGQTGKNRFCLRAGKLENENSLQAVILDISFSGQKLISEIYFALRDYNWGTIPYPHRKPER